MSFEDWWKKPVKGSKYSKEEMREHILLAMRHDGIDLKKAMLDAYNAGYAHCCAEDLEYD